MKKYLKNKLHYLKLKVRAKLRKYIEEIIGINNIGRSIRGLSESYSEIEEENIKLRKELDLFKSVTDISVDVHERTDSWAVVCIAGKKEYVKFVRLEQRDARDVLSFLRQFEKSKSMLIDAPYCIMDTIKW